MPSSGTVKCLMQFDDGKYGWREAYYANGSGNLLPNSNNQVNMVAMLPVFLPLIKARAKMLAGPSNAVNCGGIGSYSGSCNGPVLTQVRLSQTDFLRNSMIFNPISGDLVAGGTVADSLSTVGLNGLGIDQPADNPYSAIEMVMSLANGLVSKRALSGVPDGVVCDQSWSKTTNGWYGRWKSFAKVLTNGSYGTVSSSMASNGITQLNAGGTQITDITVASDCSLTVQVASIAPLIQTSPGLCPATRFQIYCYDAKRGYKNLNGIYRGVINSTDSAAPFVQLRYSGPCPQFNFPGFIRVYTGPTFVKINAATLGETMLKRRGGPFDRRRGRRRVTR